MLTETLEQAGAGIVQGQTLYVATHGDDAASGAANAPLRTISAAAERAQPGDTVLVHAGIYRERIDPPRGGTSDATRITYAAAPGEEVVVTGSEVIADWTRAEGDSWVARIPNSLFGDFNPFADIIWGDWFNGRGRHIHTGCVFLDGKGRTEARVKEDVTAPLTGRPLWFAEVGEEETTVWAQFERDPAQGLVEVTVRRTIFYPSKTNLDYITVRGFTMRHAATPWAPPTAEQIGIIGTNWSRGWIIEDNKVSHARCCGITLGKHGDQYDNQAANSAEGYVLTIERAHDHGWTKDAIGHHLVRGNHVSHCGQAGIAGSMGCAFSRVVDNVVHDIHLMEHFSCAEEAGIKFHAAIDTEISGNHVYRTRRALWLDWMTQGTRVVGNLMHDNGCEDIYIEVNHGPCLVANNLLLSARGIRNESTGTAYVHNLITGAFSQCPHGRLTPYLAPHDTKVLRLGPIGFGDDRWYNNLILGAFEMVNYDYSRQPVWAADNLYSPLAIPLYHEPNPRFVEDAYLQPRLVEENGNWILELDLPPVCAEAKGQTVDSARLGSIDLPRFGEGAGDAPRFEMPDGSDYAIDTDYFGADRAGEAKAIGPFAEVTTGQTRLKVWPLRD
jgi:alpha-L-arabinofuranosidase